MPGRRNAAPIDTALCRRCQLHDPAITVRNEPLCSACFIKYVSSKIVKRMETFRVRHAEPGRERVLLLPLSFGSASISLLQVLSQHLKGQAEKTGRTGFKLHVLHIRDDDLPAARDEVEMLFENAKARFPEHVYFSSSIPDLLSNEDVDSFLEPHNASSLPDTESATSSDRLRFFMASLDSATSKSDMTQILKRKSIVSFAKTHYCEAILWGDSTTKLAERTLAETAKGRGISLPWVVADGNSPFGVPFYYPLRDLLSKEIADFTKLVDPPLDALVLQATPKQPINMKNTTIDDLMRQYFQSVEREYPSIVANVVKTTGKLQPPSLEEIEQYCEVCEMPLDGQAPEKSRLCYGCIRTLPKVPG